MGVLGKLLTSSFDTVKGHEADSSPSAQGYADIDPYGYAFGEPKLTHAGSQIGSMAMWVREPNSKRLLRKSSTVRWSSKQTPVDIRSLDPNIQSELWGRGFSETGGLYSSRSFQTKEVGDLHRTKDCPKHKRPNLQKLALCGQCGKELQDLPNEGCSVCPNCATSTAGLFYSHEGTVLFHKTYRKQATEVYNNYVRVTTGYKKVR